MSIGLHAGGLAGLSTVFTVRHRPAELRFAAGEGGFEVWIHPGGGSLTACGPKTSPETLDLPRGAEALQASEPDPEEPTSAGPAQVPGETRPELFDPSSRLIGEPMRSDVFPPDCEERDEGASPSGVVPSSSTGTIATISPQKGAHADEAQESSPPQAVPSSSSPQARPGLPGASGARLGTQLAPRYPESCRRLGHEGTILLECEVGPTGVVGAVTVLHSAGCKELDRAAIVALRRAVFLPALEAGVPVAVRVVQPVTFQIQRA